MAYLTPTWWTATWVFLSQYQVSLDTGDIPQLEGLRERDVFLMPAFERAGYRKASLARLQRCRLFLQVTTLAEITYGFGHAILPWAFSGLHIVSLQLWPTL